MSLPHHPPCEFKEMGYRAVRRLPTGEWIGVMKMLYTAGLFVGLTAQGYRTRFCYERLRDAQQAAAQWDGLGDPPGPWIKETGVLARLGPGVTA